ncbi:hypothetical protein NLG97_g5663 [Lecanicillium saksenae]|uniref:Uncharacterized protein n=1 Tax=Lecanicillium saksenae TaxID=468837 RepID=A0ACC1QSC9_9HYPO|nr:hypothetical protein NLG97_g5663 [Lecanicillium saksenae]
MGDSSDEGIPAWQRASEQSSTGSSSAAEATPAASTEAGSEAVKDEPRDKKVAFLKSKGVEDAHIQELLGDAPETVRLHDSRDSFALC